MTGDRWWRIKALFQEAIERNDDERGAFLEAECGGDDALRSAVERLLAAHAEADTFLASPPPVTRSALGEALARHTQAGDDAEPDDRRPPPGTRILGVRDAITLAPGAILEDRYRIDELLGEGGMGAVYRATHLPLNRTVAVKTVHPGSTDSSAIERFRREARTVAHLRHPHIVTVHDFGFAPESGFYLVMEMLVGRPLRRHLEGGNCIPLPRAQALMRQVCSAVQAAHAADVVHRDLKPENIFLEAGPEGDRVKVLDFGIAKLQEGANPAAPSITVTGAIVGTPMYMSPEQCLGERVDARTDIYALGCVLHEMLTGQPPFAAETVAALIVKHVTEAVSSEALERAGAGPGVVDVVKRALAKEPGARYATVEEFSAALDAVAAADAAEWGRPRSAPARTAPPLPATVSTDPPARQVDTDPLPAPSNLPLLLTRFVGREGQIAHVKEVLAGGRLVTLTGMGGVGKTRLALQVAPEILDRFQDGVWFVELAALGDRVLIEQVVAKALGLREEPGRPLLDTLAGFLRPRRVLLVLDNCEHLIDACATLVEHLLRACPELRVLATSREALGVPGEVIWPVPPLAVPDAAIASSGDLARYEAARLFLDRAVLGNPRFVVGERNVQTIVALCRRLEGIPLAIELAAARVRVLTLEQILERLDDRFGLLTGGGRARLPRQQTLRAAMDWSYDLLADEERSLLRRLSVFAGGWTLEAAEAVCSEAGGRREQGEGNLLPDDADQGVSSSNLLPADVLDLLGRLVDKSLVVVDQDQDRARYGMLETIRQYAREKLDESGEEDRVRARHLDWFLRFAERAEGALGGPEQSAWFARLEADHDNLRAALRQTQGETANTGTGLRLCCGLKYFWYVRGYTGEGRRWFDAALAQNSAAPAPLRAKSLYGASGLALNEGDHERGEALARESLEIYRRLGDRHGALHALLRLAFLLDECGDYDRTVAVCEEGLALGREIGHPYGVAVAHYYLGRVALGKGDLERADQCFRESLSVHREAGNQRGIAILLHSLAELAQRRKDFDLAETLVEECIGMARELGDTRLLADSLSVLGSVADDRGDHARALDTHRKALTIHRERDDLLGIAFALEGVACATAALGRAERALRLAGAASRLHERTESPPSPAERASIERSLGAAREALGTAAAGRAFDEGRALDPDRAIADAFDDT